MAPWLDEEIGTWWCLGATFRCTPSESIGMWSVVSFYATLVAVTVIHSMINGASSSEAAAASKPRLVRTQEAAVPTVATPLSSSAAQRRRQCAVSRSNRGSAYDEDLKIVCLLLLYFFSFVAGCLVWALGGVNFVHPFQIWQIQLMGSVILWACSVLFVVVHFDLGRNWSAVPEKLDGHELVTSGLYGWARHPMYAVFLWAAIGTLLAMLNAVVVWCVSGFVALTLRRIPVEERDMIELFGREYEEYRRRVPALGFPFVGRWYLTRGLEEDDYEVVQ